jgi:hypothetical protein
MAISQNPITGRMRQKMSNVVFSTVFGQNVVRSKPLTVRNPKTSAQMNHRDYFTKVVQLCKILKTVEGVAKRSSRTGRSPKMSAYSYLIKGFMNAEDRTTTPYKPIWPNVDLGPGEIGPATFTTDIDSGSLYLEWHYTNLPINASDDDIMVCVIIDWENLEWYIDPTTIQRSLESYEFVLSDGFTNVNTPKAVIAFFISPDKSKWSAEFPLLSNIR